MSSTIALLALVVFLAFLVEAALGFGATVVAVALGAFLVPIPELLAAFVPLNIVLSTYLAVRYRRDIDWRLLMLRIVPLMVAGIPVGLLVLGWGSDRLLKALFGVFVVGLSALELWRMHRPAPAESQADAGISLPAQVVLLLAGGVVHGAFATGGPMAVYVSGRVLTDKGRFRSTLSTLWLILNLVLVVGYAVQGSLDREAGILAAWLALPLGLGLVLGDWLHHRVDARIFRLAVFGLLLLAGGLLIGLG